MYKSDYEKKKDKYSLVVDDPRTLLAKLGGELSSQVLWPCWPGHPKCGHVILDVHLYVSEMPVVNDVIGFAYDIISVLFCL